MKANTSMHSEHDHAGLFSRVAHELSAALEWVTGPATSEQERVERAMAEAKRLRYDTIAMQLQ